MTNSFPYSVVEHAGSSGTPKREPLSCSKVCAVSARSYVSHPVAGSCERSGRLPDGTGAIPRTPVRVRATCTVNYWRPALPLDGLRQRREDHHAPQPWIQFNRQAVVSSSYDNIMRHAKEGLERSGEGAGAQRRSCRESGLQEQSRESLGGETHQGATDRTCQEGREGQRGGTAGKESSRVARPFCLRPIHEIIADIAEATCLRKVRHSKAGAESQMKRLAARNGTDIYCCVFCNGYHIGRRTNKTRHLEKLLTVANLIDFDFSPYTARKSQAMKTKEASHDNG